MQRAKDYHKKEKAIKVPGRGGWATCRAARAERQRTRRWARAGMPGSLSSSPLPPPLIHRQVLQQKAELRNPDEFYFAMEKSRTRQGVHVVPTAEANKYSQEELRLMKTQDIGYLGVKARTEAKVRERGEGGIALTCVCTGCNGESMGCESMGCDSVPGNHDHAPSRHASTLLKS